MFTQVVTCFFQIAIPSQVIGRNLMVRHGHDNSKDKPFEIWIKPFKIPTKCQPFCPKHAKTQCLLKTESIWPSIYRTCWVFKPPLYLDPTVILTEKIFSLNLTFQDSDTNDDLYVYTYKGFGEISSREDYEADLPKSFYQVNFHA